jgi:hypothetical protein
LYALYNNFVHTNHIVLGLFGKSPSINTWLDAAKALEKEGKL